MSSQRFTPEFKEEAVRQVVERGYGVPDVAAMAAYKVPRVIEFVDKLPRSASNKIDWRRLQDAEWNKLR